MPSRTSPASFILKICFARQQRRGARRHGNLHAFACGVADQLENILALQRIAAREDEDRNVHVGDLVDQRLAFLVRQFVGVGNRLRGGAAVLAGQIAGLRDFPDGKKRRFVVINPASCGNIVHRLHEASWGSKPSGAALHGAWGGADSGFKLPGASALAFSAPDRKTAFDDHDSHSEDQLCGPSGCD